MPSDRQDPRNAGSSVGDVRAVLAAERDGTPFLVLWDDAGKQHLHPLPRGAEGATVVIGRAATSDIPIAWDERVSRSHAELVAVQGIWAIVDNGLSRNGTFVNATRVAGRQRLVDRDVVQVGSTRIIFRDPGRVTAPSTVVGDDVWLGGNLTETQRRLLDVLCAPFVEGGPGALAATNAEIADALSLSLDAVKGHLRVLFKKFGVGDLPQNQKRMRLARLAFEAGVAPRPDRHTE